VLTSTNYEEIFFQWVWSCVVKTAQRNCNDLLINQRLCDDKNKLSQKSRITKSFLRVTFLSASWYSNGFFRNKLPSLYRIHLPSWDAWFNNGFKAQIIWDRWSTIINLKLGSIVSEISAVALLAGEVAWLLFLGVFGLSTRDVPKILSFDTQRLISKTGNSP
jgi:hypothetical protein